MTGERPTGTVTFLFTDVEGSTVLWQDHGPSMRAALASHDGVIRSAVAAHSGYVFSTAGDSCHFASCSASAPEPSVTRP